MEVNGRLLRCGACVYRGNEYRVRGVVREKVGEYWVNCKRIKVNRICTLMLVNYLINCFVFEFK